MSNWLFYLIIAGLALLVFDDKLRGHLLDKVHSTFGAVGSTVTSILGSVFGRKPPPTTTGNTPPPNPQ